MTLTVTLELTPGQEKKLRTGLARQDEESVRQLLLDVIEPMIVDLFAQTEQVATKDEDEWNRLSTLLMDTVADRLPADFTGLSDYAVSREGIYADHP